MSAQHPDGVGPRGPGKRYADGTRCVRAGAEDGQVGEALLPGPVFAAPYRLDPEREGREHAWHYGRAGNPTWQRLEQAIGSLDGGISTVYASGMAAIRAVLGLGVRHAIEQQRAPVLVLPSDGYYAARELVTAELEPLGVELRTVPTAAEPDPEVLAGASLVLLETPSNPGMDVCDIAAHVAAAHRHGALVAVDNTTATPLGQQPLRLGADVSLASDTKALAGHSDVLLGHASVSPEAESLLLELRRARTQSGAAPGPMETWLAHRGLGTLELRLQRQQHNAAALAGVLAEAPAVRGLRWPGRPEDAAHRVAAAQMSRFPGVLSFQLADAGTVRELFAACTLFSAATSFGGLHSCMDRREQWGDPVPEGFLRLSAGCEDTADLVSDLRHGLELLPAW